MIPLALGGTGLLEGFVMLVWLWADGPSLAWAVTTVAITLFLVAAYLLAGWLAVTVERERLHLALGIGLLHRNVSMDEIASCGPVRNAWWYGWGIRLTNRGWLWNVSGLDAVELTYVSGGHFRIGTDEPRRLCAAIEAARRSRAGRGQATR